MVHPANDLAVWKLRRLLRRAENLSYSDVQHLSKAQLVERSFKYTIISGNQVNVFPASLRIGNGTTTPYEHIYYIPTASIHRKSKGF
jgi:hypothetical protein